MRKSTKLIIIHRTEVEADFDSYNFVVMPDGVVLHRVCFTDRAAHAKDFNGVSVGVAFFGNFASLERSHHPTPTEAQLDAGAELIRNLRRWYGLEIPIKGHSELGLGGTSFPEKLLPGRDCPGTRGDLMGNLRRRLA